MEGASEHPFIFNVCSGASTSVLQLAHTIGQLCGYTPEIRFQPLRSGEIAHSLGDRRLIEETFALSKPTGLRKGLGATLAWMDAAGEPAVASGVA
jgi:UDP-glucose 4-epimerase